MIQSSSRWKLTTLATIAATTALFSAEPDPAQSVKRELDPNGLFYTYIDFESGWAKVAQDINLTLKDTALAKKDFVALANATGLSQIRALGLSSTAWKGGYENRFFLYMPSGQKGLLAIFPGEPATFDGARYAPADADFFAELRLDLPAVVSAAMQIALSVADSKELTTMALDTLKKDPSGYGSLLNFKGRVIAIARLHTPENSEQVKAEPSTIPPADIFLRTEGGGAVVLKTLAQKNGWKREEHGKIISFTNTSDGVETIITVEGETVTAGFPRTFVEECLARKEGLAQNATFQQALTETADKGHGVIHITPRIISELRKFAGNGLASVPNTGFGESKLSRMILDQALDSLPAPTCPVTSVIVARADGLLIREHSTHSLKAALPAISLITPDFLGQILRLSAQTYAATDADERASEIIIKKIRPDLEHANARAVRYFADHEDASTITLSALREAMPEEKLPDFNEVITDDIEFSRQSDQIEFVLKSGRKITHVYPLTPVQRTTIENNLKTMDEASLAYLLGNDRRNEADLPSLIECGYLAKVESLLGENYSQISLTFDSSTLTATTTGGQEVTYTRDPLAVLQARHRQAEIQIIIEQNLAKIDASAQKYFAKNPTEPSVSFKDLVDKEFITGITPVAGEDYSNDLDSITKNQEKLSIASSRAGAVSWARPHSAATLTAITKSLTEIEQKAAQYFAKNPKSEVVISGELLPPPVVKELKEGEPESDKTTAQELPDLSTLVIRRDYKNISITLESDQVIEVRRTKPKK